MQYITSTRNARTCLGSMLALLTLTLAGCGESQDTLPREPVWGSVTLDGAPLKAGSISFSPEAPVQGTAVAATAGAVIAGGSYSIDQAQGLMPGKYRVSILSEGGGPPTDEAPGPIMTLPLPSDTIPARYNSATTLRAEVTAGGSKPFNFDLKSQ